jgi:hypothetical protein
MKELDDIFAALAHSPFRRRFHLGARERAYVASRGIDEIVDHAGALIRQRLAPAAPRNDGKQTPYRGHPVFVAQHATATCCRSCLAKWHRIAKGSDLTDDEQAHVVAAIERWIRSQIATPRRDAASTVPTHPTPRTTHKHATQPMLPTICDDPDA